MIAITASRIQKALLHPGAAILYVRNYLKGEWLRFRLAHPFSFIFHDRRKKMNFEKLPKGIFFIENKEFLEEIVRQDFIIPTANRILNNEFGFLGVPSKILKDLDWHQDIKSGHTWPHDFYLDLRENLSKDYNKGWDIKYVWELSRFHYLIPLALALIGSFGEVVSYIRLFAVGMAAVAIADAFNSMAAGIGFKSVPALLISVFVLMLGHVLCLVLGPLSVLVHGIRLNLLEFSSHANISWSGTVYKPLKE